MVSAALRSTWDCALANDISKKKCDAYSKNWGSEHLICSDVAALDAATLKQPIDMYWGSSPCQDFSLAGKGMGLAGKRSGVFHQWIKKIAVAVNAGYAPRIIAFENVVGLLSRHSGRDLKAVIAAFSKLGYRSGALEIDARYFVPQSRPRLFVIAVRHDLQIDPSLMSSKNACEARSKRLMDFVDELPNKLAKDWIDWAFDQAHFSRKIALEAVVEAEGPTWNSKAETDRLLSLMSPQQRSKICEVQESGRSVIGTVYKRGRPDASGTTVQKAEARFDGVAGCLRTPGGGSSRQTLISVDKSQIRTRLITTREAARLMGLPDDYKLPERYNEAYHLLGDGVVVPVVAALNAELLLPITRSHQIKAAA